MELGGGGTSGAVPLQEHVQTSTFPFYKPALAENFGTIEQLRSLIKVGKTKEAKLFIRENNWPLTHPIRKHLWSELCQMHTKEKVLVDNFYWDTVKQMFDCDPENQHLPAFVDHSHLLNYHLSPNGIKLCSRILSVVSYSYPAITFCPSIYPLACLLLHYLPEEECYNSLCALLSWKQGKFVIQTKSTFEVAWRTILHLTKKFAKGAYGNISKYAKDTDMMEHLFEQWLWWIFNYLPFTHVVRVMDCFLFEGSKVLYRVAMAILMLFQKHSSKGDNVWSREISLNGVSNALIKFCQDIPVSSDKLLKVAFGIRALSQNEVNKMFIHSEMCVNSKSVVRNTSHNTLVRSRSTDGIPTSQSQVAIQAISHTLTIHELLILWSWLPTRITMYQPQLVYTTEEHGCSLTTFFQRVENYEPTLLVIKTTNNEIFGAYCSTSWKERNTKDEGGQRHTYFGTGETFLFTISPNSRKYQWVGVNGYQGDGSAVHSHATELFMAGDSKMLTIGGGNGQGILLDEDIRFGRTETCQSFNNPPLSSAHDFECKVVEVFGFVSDIMALVISQVNLANCLLYWHELGLRILELSRNKSHSHRRLGQLSSQPETLNLQQHRDPRIVRKENVTTYHRKKVSTRRQRKTTGWKNSEEDTILSGEFWSRTRDDFQSPRRVKVNEDIAERHTGQEGVAERHTGQEGVAERHTGQEGVAVAAHGPGGRRRSGTRARRASPSGTRARTTPCGSGLRHRAESVMKYMKLNDK
uniref:TLDc domain-containing protein n=1 Tax=Strigamia maritima TaxID=126957 RepID=T1JNM3_STRMM